MKFKPYNNKTTSQFQQLSDKFSMSCKTQQKRGICVKNPAQPPHSIAENLTERPPVAFYAANAKDTVFGSGRLRLFCKVAPRGVLSRQNGQTQAKAIQGRVRPSSAILRAQSDRERGLRANLQAKSKDYLRSGSSSGYRQ